MDKIYCCQEMKLKTKRKIYKKFLYEVGKWKNFCSLFEKGTMKWKIIIILSVLYLASCAVCCFVSYSRGSELAYESMLSERCWITPAHDIACIKYIKGGVEEPTNL